MSTCKKIIILDAQFLVLNANFLVFHYTIPCFQCKTHHLLLTISVTSTWSGLSQQEVLLLRFQISNWGTP